MKWIVIINLIKTFKIQFFNNINFYIEFLNVLSQANVVAQTKIQFNDRQLLQLIHQHLVQKGYSDTAGMLIKEANLSSAITSVSFQHPTKFRYSSTLTPSRVSNAQTIICKRSQFIFTDQTVLFFSEHSPCSAFHEFSREYI